VMRKLKFHEQKILKKVDFLNWKSDRNPRELAILRRYYIQDREDYHKYNKVCGLITKLVGEVRKLPADDPFRITITESLLKKLYQMGLISKTTSLGDVEHIPTSAFCRRRLSVVLVSLKFCPELKTAVSLVEQGQVRLGPDVVKDPALHITRDMADHISWSQGSRIRRHIKEFRDEIDDYELLGN